MASENQLADPGTDRVQCSIVLPAYNEGEGLCPTLSQIVRTMRRTGRAFELIVIDDGSVDDTWPTIERLRREFPEIRALRFARNFGHQLAIHAGIKHARGSMIAVMDSDGQDPPDMLPEMFTKLEDGFDVVNCIRCRRRESGGKRFCYFLFYRIYRLLTPFAIPLDSGDFSAMNRRVADVVANASRHTPFIRGMRSYAGGRQTNLSYERHGRLEGESKYGFCKLVGLAASGLTGFSKVPLRLSILLGGVVSCLSLLFAASTVFAKLVFGYPEALGWSSLVVLITFVGGMQLVVLGLVGEYIGHIFDSLCGMPTFLVRERLGFPEATVPQTAQTLPILKEEGTMAVSTGVQTTAMNIEQTLA